MARRSTVAVASAPRPIASSRRAESTAGTDRAGLDRPARRTIRLRSRPGTEAAGHDPRRACEDPTGSGSTRDSPDRMIPPATIRLRATAAMFAAACASQSPPDARRIARGLALCGPPWPVAHEAVLLQSLRALPLERRRSERQWRRTIPDRRAESPRSGRPAGRGRRTDARQRDRA